MQNTSLKLAHVLNIMLRVAALFQETQHFTRRLSASSRPVTERLEYSGRISNLYCKKLQTFYTVFSNHLFTTSLSYQNATPDVNVHRFRQFNYTLKITDNFISTLFNTGLCLRQLKREYSILPKCHVCHTVDTVTAIKRAPEIPQTSNICHTMDIVKGNVGIFRRRK